MKRILVVVDMQNDFTTGPLGNAECAAVIPKVAEVIKTGVYDRIIFTQDTHQSNYLDTQEGKRLPVVHVICLPRFITSAAFATLPQLPPALKIPPSPN